jgi:type II secretory pathway component PulM
MSSRGLASDPPSLGAPASLRAVGWRSALRRELSLLLALKLAALVLLWWLFFSPPHRSPVDAAAAGRRLAVERAAVSPVLPHAVPARGERP